MPDKFFIFKELVFRRSMVRKERLELSRVAPQDPKSSASTNSATFAFVSANGTDAPCLARYYNGSQPIRPQLTDMHGDQQAAYAGTDLTIEFCKTNRRRLKNR